GRQLVGGRGCGARWPRRPFDREAAIGGLVVQVHRLHEQLASCSTTADTLYADLWPLRQLSEDVRTRERVAPRDHDWLEASFIDLLRQRDFTKSRRCSSRNYRGTVTRDQIHADHGDTMATRDACPRETI